MPLKLSPRRDVFLICSVMAALAVLAGKTNWFTALEWKTEDSRFQWRHELKQSRKKVRVSDQVVLVGVDQKSVTPSVSPHSDRWGSGGWLSRDHWISALSPLVNHYKPKVVAYDILFQPYRTLSGGEKQEETARFVNDYLKKGGLSFNDLIQEREFPRIKLLNLLDAACNSNFSSIFFDMDSARSAGREIPNFVMACELTTSRDGVSPPWQSKSQEDAERVETLRKEQLPAETLTHLPADYPFWDNASLPFEDLAQAPIHLGYINVPRDEDGTLRRVPLVIGVEDPMHRHRPFFVPSMALRACLAALDIDPTQTQLSPKSPFGMTVDFGKEIHLWTPTRDIRIPIDAYGRMFLNFEGKIGDFQQIPYVALSDFGPILDAAAAGNPIGDSENLVRARSIQEILKGKIALIGQTFTGGTDVGPTAVDTNAPLVFIHMTVIDNILRGSFLAPLSKGWTSLLLILMPFVVGLINLQPRIPSAVLGTIELLGGYLILAFGLVYFNVTILPIVLPSLFILVTLAAIALYRFGFEQKGKQEIRKKFTTMVSGKVLQYLEEHPDSFSLSGEKREATMFFSDVEGFTSISEKLKPEKLTQILNDYLTPMTDIILSREGYVNKYAGDGIMAIWGVPYPTTDHATEACYAAVEQMAKIREMRSYFQEKYDVTLRVRMGLNSGSVSAGMMGSTQRQEYTVMGDAVNFAARLEPANKDYGTAIMIGARTYELAKEHIEARVLDRIVVKGKTEPVDVYELLAKKGELSSERREGIEIFTQGMNLYWKRDWDAAIKSFEKSLLLLPGDKASRVLIERAKDFQKEPPPADWNGAYIRTKKD